MHKESQNKQAFSRRDGEGKHAIVGAEVQALGCRHRHHGQEDERCEDFVKYRQWNDVVFFVFVVMSHLTLLPNKVKETGKSRSNPPSARTTRRLQPACSSWR